MITVNVRTAQRRGTLALAGREVRRVLSLWTQTILPPVLTAVLFLAVFGGVLGQRIQTIEGLPYLTFILPGLLVMTIAGPAFANSSTSLFQAKNDGYLDDLLSSPLRGWQLALGYLAGALVRSIVAVSLVALAAAPFVDVTVDMATLLVTLVLTGVVFSALGLITGVWAETFDQHAFVANVLVTPLALLGGIFYSARSLDEPWSTMTRINPLYYLVDATRSGVTGYHESPVWISLSVTVLVTATVLGLAAALIERGWRLRQ